MMPNQLIEMLGKKPVWLLAAFFVFFPAAVSLLTGTGFNSGPVMFYFAPVLAAWIGVFGWFVVFIEHNTLRLLSVILLDLLLVATAWMIARRKSAPTKKVYILSVGLAYACLSQILYLLFSSA